VSALPALLELMLAPEPVKAAERPRLLPVEPVVVVIAEAQPERAATMESLPPVHVRYRCEPLPGHKPVALTKARDHHCRWVVGPEGSNTFCGADKGVRDDGEPSPYCPVHQRFAFRPNQMGGAAYIKSTLKWALR